jgi:hypothetical protein
VGIDFILSGLNNLNLFRLFTDVVSIIHALFHKVVEPSSYPTMRVFKLNQKPSYGLRGLAADYPSS